MKYHSRRGRNHLCSTYSTSALFALRSGTATGSGFYVRKAQLVGALGYFSKKLTLNDLRDGHSWIVRLAIGDETGWLRVTSRRRNQGDLGFLTNPRYWIAALVGVSPFILAVMLLIFTENWNIPTEKGLLKNLADNQQDIIQSLIISSVIVAVFSTVLRRKTATLEIWPESGVSRPAGILGFNKRSGG